MKAAERTILTSRVEVDKKIHTHPIAVFPNDAAAKSFATALHKAITAGDAVTAKSLDEHVVIGQDEKPVTGVKFSVLTVPYDPAAAAVDDSIFM